MDAAQEPAPVEEANGNGQARSYLATLADLARELGADALAEEAESLAARVAEGRSYVACLGQFKRGKSSLINALIGKKVLPTGTAPVTSVVTVVRHGRFGVRVRLADDGWHAIAAEELPAYATEELNPGNSRGVRAIEIFVPAPLLEGGMCLVDTPGLGSVFDANTEATREFVPHVDAALVVLGADPPITAEEISLVDEIARQVEHLVFVLNKADRVRPEEIEEAVRFTRKVLADRLGSDPPEIYCVSALEAQNGAGPTRDWQRFVDRLHGLAAESGRDLVAAALKRGTERIRRRLLALLDQQEEMLLKPVSESRQRLEGLKQAAAAAQDALRDLGPLFDAEVAALSRRFGERRNAFLREAVPQANQQLAARVEALRGFGPSVRTQAFEEAQRIAQSLLQPWLKESAREAEAAYRQVADRFTEMAERVLDRLANEGIWVELGLADLSAIEAAMERRSRYVFTDLLRVSSPAGLIPLLQWIADALLPGTMTRRSVLRAASSFLQELLVVNASRVENTLKQRIQDNRLKLEGKIRVALKEILRTAETAILEAQDAQARGEAAVQAALERVRERRARCAPDQEMPAAL